MASWMIHLRVADRLLDRIPDLSPIEFIMGNLAPDSGRACGNDRFCPDTKITHFLRECAADKRDIDAEAFHKAWLSPDCCAAYNSQQYSFYLGYYIHLLTDRCWSYQIAHPTRLRFPDATWQEIKRDWTDLDRLYLKNRPGFRAFRAYLGSVGFVNTYLDFFPADAFEERRQAVTAFYLEDTGSLDRAYPYLTAEQANRFVEDCTAHILAVIHEQNLHN